jgi:phytanoyl-CoA dioxygenase PhyH
MRPLTQTQQRVLESLRRDGLATVPFSELLGDEGLWAQLAEGARRFADPVERQIRGRDDSGGTKPRKGGGKRKKADFIVRASGGPGYRPPDALLRYALSDQLLAVGNAYLGEPSKLTYVDMWYTAPSPLEAGRNNSQRWHRDHIDPHIVKVFTYFSEVDADAGALEYVRGSATGGPNGAVWAWSTEDHYPPDGELERLIPPSDFLTAEGPAGTVVICDTGGFHRGGFGRTARITSNFTYVSPAAVADSRAKRRFEIDERMPPPQSSAARFALS